MQHVRFLTQKKKRITDNFAEQNEDTDSTKTEHSICPASLRQESNWVLWLWGLSEVLSFVSQSLWHFLMIHNKSFFFLS